MLRHQACSLVSVRGVVKRSDSSAYASASIAQCNSPHLRATFTCFSTLQMSTEALLQHGRGVSKCSVLVAQVPALCLPVHSETGLARLLQMS